MDKAKTYLQRMYAALGGEDDAVPPSDAGDVLNWYLSRIYEMVSGEFVSEAPSDAHDEVGWWIQKFYDALSGETIECPETVNDSLEWWLQKFHEFYTGEAMVRAPDPAPNNDALAWWLDLLIEDIFNSGSIPWRFQLNAGELSLSGESLPSSFALSPATGELTVNDAQLPPGFDNWRAQNGRLYADETA